MTGNNTKGASFESVVEAVEKQFDITTSHHTTETPEKPPEKSLATIETERWLTKWGKIIKEESDREVRMLARRELYYCRMGGTAGQWEKLKRLKEDLKAKGKSVYEINEDRKENEHRYRSSNQSSSSD